MAFYDGTFTTASQSGPKRPSYPFANQAIPDTYPVAYDRSMMVLPANYSPQMATRTTVTNLLTYSEQFDNAAWTKMDATIFPDTAFNPENGTATADQILETATTAQHYVTRNVAAITAAPTTLSVFSKANGRDWIYLQLSDSAATVKSAFFNLATGTVGTTSSGATTAINPVGNGWYRCSLCFTAPIAGGATLFMLTSTDGSTLSYLGDITKGLLLFGAQLVTASSASAYISTTTTTRTGSAPNIEVNESTEGSDPFAFLVNETPPDIDFMMGRFTRRYARVPGNQIIPSNQWFTRPVLHNIKSGTSYAVAFDNQKYSWRFDSRVAITRLSSANAQTMVLALPSSNITFVEGGRTLNLPANSTAAFTVSQFGSVLTGLTGAAANAANGFLSVVWTGTMTSITPPSGVIVTGLSYFSATFQSTGTQTTPALTTFTVASHGGVVGDRVALWSGDDLKAMATVVSVGDANNFSVLTNDLPSANLLVNFCAFSSDATACYVNGPKLCTVKRTKKFYLPGVTSGITTYADIPDVTIYTDPISYLGRIIAVPTGYAAIAVSELDSWEGPILTQETSEVQMSDAIDTVTP